MRRSFALASILSVTGCAARQPQPTTIVIAPATPYVASDAPNGPSEIVVEGDADPLGSVAQRVLVLQSRNLGRPAEVVGIVDAHEPTGQEDLALDELRRNAASLGADAVVGVEFHHADRDGEPLHLSGLAVRYVSSR